MTRDPRTDPKPGDMLAVGDTLARVDHVFGGDVIVAVFRLASMSPFAVTPIPLIEWVQATREAGVVHLPEGDPRHTAMILEGRT